jgi:hypothetical protein
MTEEPVKYCDFQEVERPEFNSEITTFISLCDITISMLSQSKISFRIQFLLEISTNKSE